uniref:Uncharacterized protein n=1 Tax=Naja naja TaxID=35670 RepID=A0A8C6X572_NAJNA
APARVPPTKEPFIISPIRAGVRLTATADKAVRPTLPAKYMLGLEGKGRGGEGSCQGQPAPSAQSTRGRPSLPREPFEQPPLPPGPRRRLPWAVPEGLERASKGPKQPQGSLANNLGCSSPGKERHTLHMPPSILAGLSFKAQGLGLTPNCPPRGGSPPHLSGKLQ